MKNIAIIDKNGERKTTYEELERLSDKIKNKILSLCIKEDSILPICMKDSMEYIASEIGAIKAGYAFAPINIDYPKERIEGIIKECKSSVIIDENFFAEAINADILIEVEKNKINNKALVIFTSGSTGKPKGVYHTYSSFNESVLRHIKMLAIDENDNYLLLSPFNFIASITAGIFMCLKKGATVHIMEPALRKDVNKIENYVNDNDITKMFMSPQILKYFKNKSTSLKTVITGSDKVANLEPKNYKLINAYGLSETACGALYFNIDKKYEIVPIGKPMDKIEVKLLDENNNECNQGEICILGPIEGGYINVDDSKVYTKYNGKTLVHTGDIGKRLEDGNILYINRKDWMVKINGQRVEIQEIENEIKRINGIDEAVVKGFTDEYNTTVLCAYYKCHNEVSKEDIVDEIKNNLADYMIPKYFVKVDEFKLNANGKLDRLQLKLPEKENDNEYVAPENEIQDSICKAFKKVLKFNKIGIMDDFFALGGDYIKALALVNELNNTNVSVADIYEGKCPKNIWNIIMKNGNNKDVEENIKDNKYISYSEESMYIEQKLNPSSVSYNLLLYFDIKGSTVNKIINGLKVLVHRHEALRSYFSEENGRIKRVVSDDILKVNTVEVNSRDEAITYAKDHNKPYDISKNVPLLFTIFTFNDEILLHLNIHHIIFDGSSARILFDELSEILSGHSLDKVKYSLTDSENEYNSSLMDEASNYYEEAFKDGIILNDMPIKSCRLSNKPVTNKIIKTSIISSDYSNIINYSLNNKVSFFEMFIASIAAVNAKYCNTEEVIIGYSHHGRSPKAHKTIGMFVNSIPVKISPKRDIKYNDYLKDTVKAIRETSKYYAYPFQNIVSKFVKERDESRHPIYDVSVNYLENDFNYINEDLSISMDSALQDMNRDITFNIRKNKDSFDIIMQYSDKLYSNLVTENMLQLVKETLINSINSNLSVRETMILPENQINNLESFNYFKEYKSEELVHKIFENKVKENPSKVILMCSDGNFTYDELNKRANKLAHTLIDRGFKVGDSCTILLNRDSNFFVAFLGVLKAGGSYIPTDIDYPYERIKNIIQDSNSKFVITTKDIYKDFSSINNPLYIEDTLRYTNDENLNINMSSDNLAYMIYTSGSTGKPKGVMIRHKSLANFCINDERNVFTNMITQKVNKFLSLTTVAFDMSLKELVATILNSITVVFASEECIESPSKLIDLFITTKADGFNCTPSRMQQFIKLEGFMDVLKNLQLIGCGGEPYPNKLLVSLKELTNTTLINTYGPTETTISSNIKILQDNINVGKPCLNVKEYIVDKYNDIMPLGCIGELYIGGKGVALGYKNLDELTQKSFIKFNGVDVYKSGDYAKWTEEGDIEILGRKDDRVKLRGLRIELSEIQSVINQFDGVNESAVLINNDEELAAFIVANKEIDFEELTKFIKDRVPYYMIPTRIEKLDKFSVTPNGKTDYKALKSYKFTEIKETQKSKTKANALEKELLKIICDAIDNDNIDINSNLISCGLTSLKAIAVSANIEERFNCSIKIKELLSGKSIMDIEDIIIDNLLNSKDNKDVKSTKTENTKCKLTSSMLGVYYDVMKNPTEIKYNIPGCLIFSNSINEDKLIEALVSTIKAHPHLNTKIVSEKGEIYDIPNDEIIDDTEILHMSEEEVNKYKVDFVRPFSIHNDRLYRFSIVITDKHKYLFFDFHHIVFDGFSKTIFLKDLGRAYEGIELEKEKYTYYDFAKEDRSSISDEEYFDKLLCNMESVSSIPQDLKQTNEIGKLKSQNYLILL